MKYADIPENVLAQLERESFYQMAIEVIAKRDFDPLTVSIELAKEDPAEFCRLAAIKKSYAPVESKLRWAATARMNPSQPWDIEDVSETGRKVIVEFLAEKNSVGAIKHLHEISGWGLKKAKDWVDGYKRHTSYYSGGVI